MYKRQVLLPDRVAKIVQEEYNKLKPSSKPVLRSNGVKEWTVLASTLLLDSNTGNLKMISLSTGVKALPDKELSRSGGKMIHDCHAEILALRGFNTVLLKDIDNMNQNLRQSDLLEISDANGKYHLRAKWKLILYISRLPCGDASMRTLSNSSPTSSSLKSIDDSDEFQYIDPNIPTILRGRLNFSRNGVVRTKPGRLDSLTTLSKSCSDKLCLRQVTSILNCMTWSLLDLSLIHI